MVVQQEVGVITLECGMTMALAGHLVGNCLKEQSQTNRVRHKYIMFADDTTVASFVVFPSPFSCFCAALYSQLYLIF